MAEYGNGAGKKRRQARRRRRKIGNQKPAKESADRCSEMTGKRRSGSKICAFDFKTPKRSMTFKTRTRFRPKKKTEIPRKATEKKKETKPEIYSSNWDDYIN